MGSDHCPSVSWPKEFSEIIHRILSLVEEHSSCIQPHFLECEPGMGLKPMLTTRSDDWPIARLWANNALSVEEILINRQLVPE